MLEGHLKSLVNALESFHVGHELLGPGEAELAVVIPRSAVKNEVGELADDLEGLDKIFGCLAEVATGQRADLKIRTISSSDLTFLLEVLPEVGAAIAFSVRWLVQTYKDVLEIKKNRQDLANKEIPQEVLDDLDAHIQERVDAAIADGVEELFKEFDKRRPAGRKEELRNELRRWLGELMKRIDHGYHVEVRAAPREDGEEEEERDESAEHLEKISELAAQTPYVAIAGRPVLYLPGPDDQEDADGAADESPDEPDESEDSEP